MEDVMKILYNFKECRETREKEILTRRKVMQSQRTTLLRNIQRSIQSNSLNELVEKLKAEKAERTVASLSMITDASKQEAPSVSSIGPFQERESKRAAAQKAKVKVQNQATMLLNRKLRRPSRIESWVLDGLPAGGGQKVAGDKEEEEAKLRRGRPRLLDQGEEKGDDCVELPKGRTTSSAIDAVGRAHMNPVVELENLTADQLNKYTTPPLGQQALGRKRKSEDMFVESASKGGGAMTARDGFGKKSRTSKEEEVVKSPEILISRSSPLVDLEVSVARRETLPSAQNVVQVDPQVRSSKAELVDSPHFVDQLRPEEEVFVEPLPPDVAPRTTRTKLRKVPLAKIEILTNESSEPEIHFPLLKTRKLADTMAVPTEASDIPELTQEERKTKLEKPKGGDDCAPSSAAKETNDGKDLSSLLQRTTIRGQESNDSLHEVLPTKTRTKVRRQKDVELSQAVPSEATKTGEEWSLHRQPEQVLSDAPRLVTLSSTLSESRSTRTRTKGRKAELENILREANVTDVSKANEGLSLHREPEQTLSDAPRQVDNSSLSSILSESRSTRTRTKVRKAELENILREANVTDVPKASEGLSLHREPEQTPLDAPRQVDNSSLSSILSESRSTRTRTKVRKAEGENVLREVNVTDVSKAGEGSLLPKEPSDQRLKRTRTKVRKLDATDVSADMVTRNDQDLSPELRPMSTRTKKKKAEQETCLNLMVSAGSKLLELEPMVLDGIMSEAVVEVSRTVRPRTKVTAEDRAEAQDENRPLDTDLGRSNRLVKNCVTEQISRAAVVPVSDQLSSPGKVKQMVRKYDEAAALLTPKTLEKIKQDHDNKENPLQKMKVKPIINGSSLSNEKIPLRKGTPLATNNRILTTFSAAKTLSSGKMKITTLKQDKIDQEEWTRKQNELLLLKKKEEIVKKKREERLKATKDETRRKREEKVQKAAALREAVEREKSEALARAEREKEEREAAAMAEKARAREEAILLKKKQHQAKLKEAEERRAQEEAARIARLKEQEEEQKRLAEIRQRQQAEAEKLHQQRLAEEQRTKAAAIKAMQEKAKNKVMKVPPSDYDMTPPRTEREKQPSKSDEDYGIDDLNPDESSDDESHPKKQIPRWASKPCRSEELPSQAFIPADLISAYFDCPHKCDIVSMFSPRMHRRPRTSSAVWNIPPRNAQPTP